MAASRRIQLFGSLSPGAEGPLLGGYLYAGTNSNPAVVVKVRLADFTVVDSLSLNLGESIIACMCTDGTYLYVILETMPARVVRIDLATFTRVDHIDLSDNNGTCCDIFNTVWGLLLFVGLATVPGRISGIDIATFMELGLIDLDPGQDRCVSIVHDDDYWYVTCHPPAGGDIVVKLDRTDLDIQDSVNLMANAVRWCQSTTVVNDKLYVALWDSHAHLIRVDTATMVVDGDLSDLTTTMGVVIGVDGYIYVTNAMDIKIDIATFAEVDRVGLTHMGAGIRYVDGYLYTGGTSTISKVSLDPFAFVASLNIDAAFHDITCLLYSDVG